MMGAEQVVNKFGVSPELFRDYQAIMGDATVRDATYIRTLNRYSLFEYREWLMLNAFIHAYLRVGQHSRSWWVRSGRRSSLGKPFQVCGRHVYILATARLGCRPAC